jgi:hypothetical protein
MSVVPAVLIQFARPQQIHFNISPAVFRALWIGFAALIVLMLYSRIRQLKQRTGGLRQLAMQSGYEFFEKPDAALDAELAAIQIQQPRIGSQRFQNVLRGSYGGHESILADLTFGQQKQRSYASIMSFKFPDTFPSFYLCPESTLWKLTEKLGNKDIDFDDAPEFSRKFFLHGKDEAAIRQFFKRDLTLAFESGVSGEYFVCTSGRWLTVYRPNRLLPVAQVLELKQKAEAVVEAFRKARPAF